MPLRITWATFPPPAAPMGLQAYESCVLEALRATTSNWVFDHRLVGGLRGPREGVTRIPTRLLRGDSHRVAAACGRWAYRGSETVHRFDLRLPPPNVPEVVTVHDLPPLRFDDEGRLPDWSLASARGSRMVICPSSFAAEEVSTLLGVERVVVIPYGLNQVYVGARPLSDGELAKQGLRHPFVLHAGGATRRKNLSALATAWPEVIRAVPQATLALAGPPDARRDGLFGDAERVVLLGHQTPPAVARLMASATCVVVPSIYEGFGLPALEGMASGSVVVAAARGALPEVCGEAAVLCEPDPAGLAVALRSVLEDADLRADLKVRGARRAASFSWDRAATAHIKAYDSAFR